jgi:hypothetical protein
VRQLDDDSPTASATDTEGSLPSSPKITVHTAVRRTLSHGPKAITVQPLSHPARVACALPFKRTSNSELCWSVAELTANLFLQLLTMSLIAVSSTITTINVAFSTVEAYDTAGTRWAIGRAFIWFLFIGVLAFIFIFGTVIFNKFEHTLRAWLYYRLMEHGALLDFDDLPFCNCNRTESQVVTRLNVSILLYYGEGCVSFGAR